MKRSQANRDVIAARCITMHQARQAQPVQQPDAEQIALLRAYRPGTLLDPFHPHHRPRSVGTNPARRVQTTVTPGGVIRRSRALPMTGAQRNSQGKRSEWNDSPEFFTDPAWSQTVSNQHR